MDVGIYPHESHRHNYSYDSLPTSAGGYGGSPRDSFDDNREWVLDDLLYRGQTYLHDKKTGLVYSPNGNGWPRLVGRLKDGYLVEQKQIHPGDLFQRLDDFLKARQIRLQNLFDRFDSDRCGWKCGGIRLENVGSF